MTGRVPARGEAERDDGADRREDAEPVPVADRRVEPVDGERVVAPDPCREEPRRERVRAVDRRGREHGAEQRTHGPRGREREHGDDGADQDEPALPVENRRRQVDRPDAREPRPRDERSDESEEGELEPADARPSVRRMSAAAAAKKKASAAPAPRGREVPAVRRRERRRGDERAGEEDHLRQDAAASCRGAPGHGDGAAHGDTSGRATARRRPRRVLALEPVAQPRSARWSATSTAFVFMSSSSPICRALRSAPKRSATSSRSRSSS